LPQTGKNRKVILKKFRDETLLGSGRYLITLFIDEVRAGKAACHSQ
jgi:hypothetical protein